MPGGAKSAFCFIPLPCLPAAACASTAAGNIGNSVSKRPFKAKKVSKIKNSNTKSRRSGCKKARAPALIFIAFYLIFISGKMPQVAVRRQVDADILHILTHLMAADRRNDEAQPDIPLKIQRHGPWHRPVVKLWRRHKEPLV